MKRAGIDHIVVEGQSESPVYICIHDNDVEIRDASHLWGKTTWETDRLIKEELGDHRVQMRYIGQAGERLVHGSPIIGNLNHSGGRAGCGETMGSKKLKAVAVRGTGRIAVSNPELFSQTYRKFLSWHEVGKARDPWIPVWSIFGAPVLMRLFHEGGNLQTFNAKTNQWKEEIVETLSGERFLEKYVVKSKAGFCCPYPSCIKYYEVRNGKYGGTKGANYWAAQPVAFASLIGLENFEAILHISSLCNQYGLDIFDTGYTLAWAMECFENGILTLKDTDGIKLVFGNEDAIVEMIRKIAFREGLGDVLANGSEEASRIIGKGSEQLLLNIKGQELEGMPQRSTYIIPLGLAVSEVGPDHTRFYPPYPINPTTLSAEQNRDFGDVYKKFNADIDFVKALQLRDTDGKGKHARFLTMTRAILESLPTCLFVLRGALAYDLRIYHDFLRAVTGTDMSFEEMLQAGERIVTIERAFIVREGYRRKDDRPPRRMLEEPLPEQHLAPLTQENLDVMLDEYYKANGWDHETAIPLRKTLSRLGLDKVIQDFQELGIVEDSK
jgi:aldehyde:ferredoxin oxidoreductase